MNIKNWKVLSFKLVFLGAGAYIILTLIAMIFYAGGTNVDSNTEGYSFLNNFFSDLGRTEAYSEKPNTISWILFTLSIFIVGIALTLFYLAWVSLFKDDDSTHRLSQVGSIFGVFGALAFIGVGLTPADLLRSLHILSVRIGFISVFIASVVYSFALYRHNTYPRKYFYTILTFSGICLIYIILLFFGPSPETSEGLIIQVVGQKIIVYIMAIVYAIQGYGALGVSSSG